MASQLLCTGGMLKKLTFAFIIPAIFSLNACMVDSDEDENIDTADQEIAAEMDCGGRMMCACAGPNGLVTRGPITQGQTCKAVAKPGESCIAFWEDDCPIPLPFVE